MLNLNNKRLTLLSYKYFCVEFIARKLTNQIVEMPIRIKIRSLEKVKYQRGIEQTNKKKRRRNEWKKNTNIQQQQQKQNR